MKLPENVERGRTAIGMGRKGKEGRPKTALKLDEEEEKRRKPPLENEGDRRGRTAENRLKGRRMDCVSGKIWGPAGKAQKKKKAKTRRKLNSFSRNQEGKNGGNDAEGRMKIGGRDSKMK
jgi:hypothetical protein